MSLFDKKFTFSYRHLINTVFSLSSEFFFTLMQKNAQIISNPHICSPLTKNIESNIFRGLSQFNYENRVK